MAVGMLGGESEEAGDAQGDPGGDGLRLDPEADPRHHDDQTSGDVRVEQVVPQTPPKLEYYLETREVAC